MKKKVAAGLLALVMTVASIGSVFAADVKEGLSAGEAKVDETGYVSMDIVGTELDVTELELSVTMTGVVDSQHTTSCTFDKDFEKFASNSDGIYAAGWTYDGASYVIGMTFAEDTAYTGTIATLRVLADEEGKITISNNGEVVLEKEFKKASVKIGDVTGDGNIQADDALEVLKHVVKLQELSGDALKAADTNEDGEIGAEDALNILKYAVKLVASLPVAK